MNVTTDSKKDNMWNNRIFYNPKNNNYSVHETFYKDGEIWACAKNPESGYFESVEDLIGYYKIISDDVLKYKDDIIDMESLEKKIEEDSKKEDNEIDTYKCFDFTLFELSNHEITLFEFYFIFREIHWNRSLLKISLKSKFSVDELLFFRIKKSIL